jgi:sulfite reductase alpha subunit-like flavoprotein
MTSTPTTIALAQQQVPRHEHNNSNNNDSSATVRTERILVLYGSQTGNCEQVANDFCNQIQKRLSPEILHSFASKAATTTDTTTASTTNTTIIIEPVCMQLDDFLEIEHSQWTQFFIIFVSSYGVGQAPMGSIRFRELADYWLNNTTSTGSSSSNTTDNVVVNDKSSSSLQSLLNGTYYAMCGLGDSKYTTYFNNPNTINTALQHVGSQRIGVLGKADASSTGINNKQFDIIEHWIDTIWDDLAVAIVSKPQLSKEQLQLMQVNTMKICQQINPDLQEHQHKKENKSKRRHNTTKKSNPLSPQSLSILLLSSENLFYFGIVFGVIIAMILYKRI